jgi:tape measure domain-containing protein
MAFTVDIRGNATHLEKTLRTVKGSIASLGSVATASVGSLAALGAAGAAGLTAFAVSSSQAAASLEDLSIQFEVLTGSAKSSADLLKAFREEEKKSSLNTEDYANAAKNLLGFGMNLEEVVPTLKMLGDVSMGNSDRFGSLALAFAQTTAAGRLMGQEVLQFINAGFNPLSQIAKDTGKSMADLKKEMEDGKISVDMVKQAFMNATSAGGLFYKAIEKGSSGTNAKINQTKAAVTQLQVAFGTGFNEGLKDALDAANNFLPQLESKFAEAGQIVGTAITQAVQGNLEQLATLGAFAGEIFFAGFKGFYMRAMDELVTGAGNTGSLAVTSPTAVAGGRMLLGPNAPSLAQMTGTPDLQQNVPLAQYLQSALEGAQSSQSGMALQKLAIENGIAEGLRKGDLTEGMRKEVREGILEAWAKNPSTTGARFSN